MHATLESLGLLPRQPLAISVVDQATVRHIIRSERALIAQAYKLGLDIDELNRGWTVYLDRLRDQLSDHEKSEFNRLFVAETLSDDNLDEEKQAAEANLAEAERQLAESQEELAKALQRRAGKPAPAPLSTARIFFAGVNTTILIGCALFWIFR